MSQGRHARVRELFLELCDLEQAEALRILDEKCVGEPELHQEVLSLLDFDVDQDVVLQSVRTETRGLAHAPVVPDRRPSEQTGALVSRVVGGQGRQRAWGLLLLAGLVALGFYLHMGVRRTLREQKLDGLAAINSTAVAGLDAWVRKREEFAVSLVNEESVRVAVNALCDISARQLSSPEMLGNELRDGKGKQPCRSLGASLASYYSFPGSAGVAVHDVRGTSLYWGGSVELEQDRIGRMWGALPQSFGERARDSGEPVFIRPVSAAFWGREGRGDWATRAISWICAPVYDKALGDSSRKVIAVMSFGKFADSLFSTILNEAKSGETCETYAFDREGRMVSVSRFKDQLKDLGIVQEGEQIYISLNISLRPPGEEPLMSRPFIPAVAQALASSPVDIQKRDLTAHWHGKVAESYSDYRGVKVLGVWSWVEAYDMGLITEVDVAEANGALQLLDRILLALFLLIVVLGTMSLFFSFSMVRLRSRVGEQQRLGQYTLIKKIGEGGMGVVYLAQHALLKRPTAVKILVDDRNQHESIARFEREVQLASQLTHPNTIEVYDFGRTPEGTFFYAMEFLNGLTLAELIDIEGPVGPGRVIHILKQVCGSLREAHARGLIHRDIKPLNIMLCERGGEQDVVKVLDFGLVKHVDSGESPELTKKTEVSGTLLYMSPERFRSPESVDARADIYSLGGVAYNLLTGRRLFESKTDVDVLCKVMNEPPVPIRDCVDMDLPDALVDLVERCLAKDAADRPQRVNEVLQVLEGVEHDLWSASDAEAWWRARSHLV